MPRSIASRKHSTPQGSRNLERSPERRRDLRREVPEFDRGVDEQTTIARLVGDTTCSFSTDPPQPMAISAHTATTLVAPATGASTTGARVTADTQATVTGYAAVAAGNNEERD